MRLPILFTSIILGCHRITAQPIAKIGTTDVVGKQIPGSEIDFFGGIPFAKPPLGELRLNLPVLTTTLDGDKFDATNFGPGCIQTPSPPSGVSEDCLSLSIFRPAGITSSSRLPIIVWIYGGSFTVGDSSFYNPTGLITRSVERNTPIIFVSINYRVGPLGFPTGLEAKQAKVLNLGLHDQSAALEWIQANIANFGGDKTKVIFVVNYHRQSLMNLLWVTIMGESAGAASVQVHLLERRFLDLPEPPGHRSKLGKLGGSDSRASSIAENKIIECIRKSDTAALLQAQAAKGITFTGSLFFGPVIDGQQGLIADRWSRNPPQSHLPLLLGSNLDEGTIFAAQDTNSTRDIRDVVLKRISPPLLCPAQVNEGLDTLLELYPDVPSVGSPFGTRNNTFGLNSQYNRESAIQGDFTFTSGRRIMAQTRSEIGDKTFAYLFTDHEATAVPEFAPVQPAPGSIGVAHTSEIPSVFGTLTNVSPRALALAATMQDYWISFVISLDPNDGHRAPRPNWQQYTPDNQAVIKFDGSGITTIPDNFRENQIAFFANNPDLPNT